MRISTRAAVVAAALSVGLSLAATPPSGAVTATTAPAAERASGSLTLTKIRAKTTPYRGKVTIKPAYRRSGLVAVDSAQLTVKKGKRVVVRNKPMARLAAGRYTVTQAVRYRIGTRATRGKMIFPVGSTVTADYGYGDRVAIDCTGERVLEPGVSAEAACTIEYGRRVEDYNEYYDPDIDYHYVDETTWTVRVPLTYDETDGRWELSNGAAFGYTDGPVDPVGMTASPDEIVTPDDLVATIPYTRYGATRRVTKTQTLVIKSDRKPRGCATRANFDDVYVDWDGEYGDTEAQVKRTLQSGGRQVYYSSTGDGYIEVREYRACTRGARIRVGFDTGIAYAKAYSR